MDPILILAILVLPAFFIWFGGRALSRKRAFPCPAFLAWLVDPHYQSMAKVKELAAACGFRPGARHGNRFQYSLVLKKPGQP